MVIYLAFDTETTSLSPNILAGDRFQPKVIELYACLFMEGSAIHDELHFVCDPGEPISEETTKITGITQEEVNGKPPFSEFIPQVTAFFARADAAIAHNLSFDKRVLEIEFKRKDKGLERWWPEEEICTVEATEHLKGHRLKLIDLHELLTGERFTGAHRADADVKALVTCFQELLAKGEV